MKEKRGVGRGSGGGRRFGEGGGMLESRIYSM